MKIGIIGGTGAIGSALAARLAAAGHSVLVGSRDPENGWTKVRELKERWSIEGDLLAACSYERAASADVVIVAAPWPDVVAIAETLANDLAGKTVISTVNRLTDEDNSLVPVGEGNSAALALQEALPASRLVTGFNHIPASSFGKPDAAADADVCLCANDEKAVADASAVVNAIPGLRALFVGDLSLSRAVEDFAAVIVGLNGKTDQPTSIRFAAQTSVE